MPQVTSIAPGFEAEAVIGKEFKKIKLSDYKG
ncbi:MAG TPA: peroxiredoxin, partial [Leptospiraceae bacterium]|nr:peroxiredoxin [Leptospiraceae bacterium]